MSGQQTARNYGSLENEKITRQSRNYFQSKHVGTSVPNLTQNIKIQSNNLSKTATNNPLPSCKSNNYISAENLATLNSFNEKKYADIKIKLGDKRPNRFDADRDSIPSDISENAWDELPKYNHFMFL